MEVIPNRKETSCLAPLRAGFEPRVSGTECPADWMQVDKPTELSRIKLEKTRIRTRIHIHVYTYIQIYVRFFLLILMLWHRQAIFDSKGDELFSSAECRIRSWEVACTLNADWAIDDQAKTWNQQLVPMMSEHSSQLTSLPVGFRTWTHAHMHAQTHARTHTHTYNILFSRPHYVLYTDMHRAGFVCSGHS